MRLMFATLALAGLAATAAVAGPVSAPSAPNATPVQWGGPPPPPGYGRPPRGYYDEPPPGPPPGYYRPYRRVRYGEVCVTSRGNCAWSPQPIGARCRCDIPGFGKKRGIIEY